jgi:hypothetical protein
LRHEGGERDLACKFIEEKGSPSGVPNFDHWWSGDRLNLNSRRKGSGGKDGANLSVPILNTVLRGRWNTLPGFGGVIFAVALDVHLLHRVPHSIGVRDTFDVPLVSDSRARSATLLTSF